VEKYAIYDYKHAQRVLRSLKFTSWDDYFQSMVDVLTKMGITKAKYSQNLKNKIMEDMVLDGKVFPKIDVNEFANIFDNIANQVLWDSCVNAAAYVSKTGRLFPFPSYILMVGGDTWKNNLYGFESSVDVISQIFKGEDREEEERRAPPNASPVKKEKIKKSLPSTLLIEGVSSAAMLKAKPVLQRFLDDQYEVAEKDVVLARDFFDHFKEWYEGADKLSENVLGRLLNPIHGGGSNCRFYTSIRRKR
jgi:hypothetical protein